MGNSTFVYRNLHQVLLCSLYAFGNSSGNLAGLTQAPADNTILVTHNDNGAKGESTATLGYLSNTVDSNQTVLQLDIAINLNFIECHNYIRI